MEIEEGRMMVLPSVLRNFPPLFALLTPPLLADLCGVYRAAFAGPRWLQAVAPQGLKPVGLGGWWGKVFDGVGNGRNLVQRGGAIQEVLPVTVAERPSLVDGQPCLAVCYAADSRFPWPHVVDELRTLPDGRLLGLTLANVTGLRRLPLPFLLTPVEQ